MTTYDFLIIGGGSAGYAAARTAAALGLRTAVVDGAEELGGLCILRGCMPSKTLLATAERAMSIRRAEEFGLRAEGFEVKGKEIIARKRKLIEDFASYRREQLQSGKFTLIRGTASFVDAHTVEVQLREGGNERVTARSFLIATGSVIPEAPLPGLRDERVWTSDDVLDQPHIPKSVIVLGGGAIAVELASYYAGLGRDVTLIQRSPQLLKTSDADVGEALREGLVAHGIKVYTDTKLVDSDEDSVTFLHGGDRHTIHAERIVNALGRVPNIRGLNLSAAGVEVTDNRPTTQLTQQTSQAHIFAAGDVAGPHEIVHIAIQQGEIAARNAARVLGVKEDSLEQTDYRLKLFAVFSSPELAECGQTERELTAAGVPFRVAKYPFNDHGKSMTMGEMDGFVKLIAHTETGELLGGAVVGPHASELIHEIVVAMRFRATAKQLAETPHYHPTLSEIWAYPAEELS